MQEDSKELLKQMFDNQAEMIDLEMDYIYGQANKLIKLAYDLNCPEIAHELKEKLRC